MSDKSFFNPTFTVYIRSCATTLRVPTVPLVVVRRASIESVAHRDSQTPEDNL